MLEALSVLVEQGRTLVIASHRPAPLALATRRLSLSREAPARGAKARRWYMADRAPGLVATLSPGSSISAGVAVAVDGGGSDAAGLVAALGLLALSGWFITATALTGLVLASGGAAMLDVYVPGGGIRAFALTRTVARYLERLYNHDTVLRLLADLRGHMFAVLADLDAARLSRRRASDWLNRLTADIDTLDSLFLRLLAPAWWPCWQFLA